MAPPCQLDTRRVRGATPEGGLAIRLAVARHRRLRLHPARSEPGGVRQVQQALAHLDRAGEAGSGRAAPQTDPVPAGPQAGGRYREPHDVIPAAVFVVTVPGIPHINGVSRLRGANSAPRPVSERV